MVKQPSIYSNSFWNIKCVEPRKRNKDGMHWIVHRFPIKNGISIRDTMIYDAMRPHPWLKHIRIV